MISRAVLLTDSEGEFSHVGAIVRDGDRVIVVHAEPGDRFEDGRVRAEPIDAFLAPDRATAWAVLRPVEPLDSMEARAVTEAALRHVRNRTPFDGALDADDPSALYCTELILDLYRAASRDPEIPTRSLQLFRRPREVLFPSDIASSPAFHLIETSPAEQRSRGPDIAR